MDDLGVPPFRETSMSTLIRLALQVLVEHNVKVLDAEFAGLLALSRGQPLQELEMSLGARF